MYRKEINERSPIRLLERSIHNGLGKGNIGVVAARAGIGKTACLVQIALDDLLRERRVFHVSLEQPVHRVRSWYDEMFHEVVTAYKLPSPDTARVDVERLRQIHTYVGHSFTIDKLREALRFSREHLHFEPDMIVIDDFPWNEAKASEVKALKALAAEVGAEIWMSALTHREEPVVDPAGIPKPVDQFTPIIDVVVSLVPDSEKVMLRLLKDHGEPVVTDISIGLDPRTMLLV
ncbi:MAG: AAA family ATPase [Myxococcales bacterium]|nr:AAA family ATPase [Myxococcales bacterium]